MPPKLLFSYFIIILSNARGLIYRTLDKQMTYTFRPAYAEDDKLLSVPGTYIEEHFAQLRLYVITCNY